MQVLSAPGAMTGWPCLIRNSSSVSICTHAANPGKATKITLPCCAQGTKLPLFEKHDKTTCSLTVGRNLLNVTVLCQICDRNIKWILNRTLTYTTPDPCWVSTKQKKKKLNVCSRYNLTSIWHNRCMYCVLFHWELPAAGARTCWGDKSADTAEQPAALAHDKQKLSTVPPVAVYESSGSQMPLPPPTAPALASAAPLLSCSLWPCSLQLHAPPS